MTHSYMRCVFGGTSRYSSALAEGTFQNLLRRQSMGSARSSALPAPIPTVIFLPTGRPERNCMFSIPNTLYLSSAFSVSWLYALILAIDANFRLKNKDRKVTNDPPLGDGWAHWVPQGPYHEYIQQYGHQEEVLRVLWYMLLRITNDICFNLVVAEHL
jgi:hypothetical protein